jgi:translation initiation factor 4A
MAGLEDISAADISESNWNEACATFDEMELKEDLLRGIYAYGFEKPSTIQQRGIVPIVRGFDTIAQPSLAQARPPRSPSASCSAWTWA